jgi:hypothetical protein
MRRTRQGDTPNREAAIPYRGAPLAQRKFKGWAYRRLYLRNPLPRPPHPIKGRLPKIDSACRAAMTNLHPPLSLLLQSSPRALPRPFPTLTSLLPFNPKAMSRPLYHRLAHLPLLPPLHRQIPLHCQKQSQFCHQKPLKIPHKQTRPKKTHIPAPLRVVHWNALWWTQR